MLGSSPRPCTFGQFQNALGFARGTRVCQAVGFAQSEGLPGTPAICEGCRQAEVCMSCPPPPTPFQGQRARGRGSGSERRPVGECLSRIQPGAPSAVARHQLLTGRPQSHPYPSPMWPSSPYLPQDRECPSLQLSHGGSRTTTRGGHPWQSTACTCHSPWGWPSTFAGVSTVIWVLLGAPTTAQAEALQSEEVDTKLLLRAPCRVRADHLVGIILVSLIAVLWQVAGLDKEVTQAIVFTVHNIPRISGARGDLVRLWRVRVQGRGSSHGAT